MINKNSIHRTLVLGARERDYGRRRYRRPRCPSPGPACPPKISSVLTEAPAASFFSNRWRRAGRIILVDATADENPIGTVTRTTPKFSRDYPPTLTAHDIGVKDLLDAFYMQGGTRDVVLYAITIDPHQKISMELSDAGKKAVEEAAVRILAELKVKGVPVRGGKIKGR